MGCHFLLQCMKVKSESEVTQSCPTLNDPMDCSLPGSSTHGIFQARVLGWCAIAFSESLKWQKVKDKEKTLKTARGKKKKKTSHIKANTHKAINKFLCKKIAGQIGVAQYIQSILKGEKQQPKIIYPENLLIRIIGKMKNLSDKQQLKELISPKINVKGFSVRGKRRSSRKGLIQLGKANI